MFDNPRSEKEALAASRIALLSGWQQDGEITEASEDTSRRGNEMLKLVVVVKGRTFFDYLTDTPQGVLRLRHALAAVGGDALARYDAGEGVRPEDFAGARVSIKLKIERRGQYPARSVIEDYRAVASPVVNLRTAVKAGAFLVGVSLAAVTSGCAGGVDPFNPYPPHGFYAAPQGYQQRYAPPQAYAAPSYPSAQPVARYNPATRRFEGGNMASLAAGAGLGLVGGHIASNGFSGARNAATAAEVGEAVTAGRAVGTVAEAAEAGEALTAGRAGAAAVGAVEAVEPLAGAEAAEALEVFLSRFWWLLLE